MLCRCCDIFTADLCNSIMPKTTGSDTQSSVRDAVLNCGIDEHTSCRTLRCFFAICLHLIGYNMRTVQELFGYTDVRTTVIYTHALDRGTGGVIGSLDKIRGSSD